MSKRLYKVFSFVLSMLSQDFLFFFFKSVSLHVSGNLLLPLVRLSLGLVHAIVNLKLF